MGCIKHENIVHLRAVLDDEDEDNLYLILEHAPGGQIMHWNVKTYIYEQKDKESTKHGGLPLPMIQKISKQLITAVKYLHSKGIIHRDIKPENLLLSAEGDLKICDFGVADKFEGDATICDSAGTYHFFAPEACTGDDFCGYKADIWAIGVTLYVFVFGRVPFFREDWNTQALFEDIAEGNWEYPADAPPIDADLDGLLKAVLCVDVDERLTLDEMLAHPFFAKAL